MGILERGRAWCSSHRMTAGATGWKRAYIFSLLVRFVDRLSLTMTCSEKVCYCVDSCRDCSCVFAFSSVYFITNGNKDSTFIFVFAPIPGHGNRPSLYLMASPLNISLYGIKRTTIILVLSIFISLPDANVVSQGYSDLKLAKDINTPLSQNI